MKIQYICILTSALATWFAMVNIRLSVISHGGSPLSWKGSHKNV